jgi:hypothetical protein
MTMPKIGIYLAFVFSILGILFPHFFSGGFLDDPKIVRWMSWPLLILTGIVLADAHLFQNAIVRYISNL